MSETGFERCGEFILFTHIVEYPLEKDKDGDFLPRKLDLRQRSYTVRISEIRDIQIDPSPHKNYLLVEIDLKDGPFRYLYIHEKNIDSKELLKAIASSS